MFMDKVYFEKINNKKVFCILSEPKPCQKKIVIMSHGFRGSSIGPARTFVDFAKILNQNGISTLRFDQPNCGNSQGEFLNSSFNEWVDTTAYFAEKYLDQGYKVALLGQSIGATTSVVVSARKELEGKIRCLLLWVPDPKSTFNEDPNKVDEEGGQKYKNLFWQEARDSDFFKCLNNYNGRIHLVYGENDKYISQELRDQVIDATKSKGQPYMILKGQDHSPWEYDLCQKVFKEELEFVKKFF